MVQSSERKPIIFQPEHVVPTAKEKTGQRLTIIIPKKKTCKEVRPFFMYITIFMWEKMAPTA